MPFYKNEKEIVDLLVNEYPTLKDFLIKNGNRFHCKKEMQILEIIDSEENKKKYNEWKKLREKRQEEESSKNKIDEVVNELSKNNIYEKKFKTPLRYAGGKSKAIYKLEKHLPKIYDNIEIHDCFLGGGSFPLYLTKLYPTIKIKVNDVYKPLYNFWIQLRDNGDKMSDTLLEIKQKNNNPELAKILFEGQKKVMEDKDKSDFDKAVAFYILNKCGFSGLVSSSFSKMASVSNFSENGINALKYYSNLIKGWEIYNLDYKDFINQHSDKKNIFLYLDPPYMIKDNLYGDHGDLHKVFRHEEFFQICPKLNCLQLISYNSDLLIKNAFKDYNISDYDLTYTLRSTGTYMEDQKERKELAIKNY